MLKHTPVNNASWRYPWQQDFYDWLTDRPDPRSRQVWRFRGKAPRSWFGNSFLSTQGTGCTGVYQAVLKCLEGSGYAYLPATDCTPELERYFQCMQASKGFRKHWKSEFIPDYKDYLAKFDNFEIKRTSWKQTRNLAHLWYGANQRESSRSGFTKPLGKYPFFTENLYTPEGWDSRIRDDNMRSLIKDAVHPHTMFFRGQDPVVC
eukprot:TRINITY_DN6758_c0_g1_i2.p1 TRINITY_DN6758_c0_g1~~TRINITY_DN6758_c0_g1_i2.p1  ORF type:complete len:205 (+),score=9.65 TRINITY_DN6758_c0_g1_i2:65-679(+)